MCEVWLLPLLLLAFDMMQPIIRKRIPPTGPSLRACATCCTALRLRKQQVCSPGLALGNRRALATCEFLPPLH